MLCEYVLIIQMNGKFAMNTFHCLIILALFLHVFSKDISGCLTDNKYKRVHSRMNSLFDSQQEKRCSNFIINE
jgi:hypothetical protein